MKLVVCQGNSVGGSPSRESLIEYWKEQLKDVGEFDEVVFRDRFDYDKIDEICGDTDAVLGVWFKDDYFDDGFFNKFPKLKYIASFAHGFGRIDKAVVRKHGVTCTNTIYGDVTIAQFTMGLLLEICHGIRLQDGFYKELLDQGVTMSFGNGVRVKSKQIELYEKTMGIIGLGSIGYQTAKMANGFGMKILANSRSLKEGSQYDFIEQVSLEEVLRTSDVIAIHCPMTAETQGMINTETLAMMKDGVILLNTARGGIINEADLVEALNSGKVYAAGLDVVDNEPLSKRNELMSCPNAIITPHIAWVTEEARYRSVKIAAANLKNWLNNKPTSVIV